jgi:hypothetical protein
MRVKIVERKVLNPQADTDNLKVEINPIPKNIGLISLLDNTKPSADIILEIIEKNINTDKCINIKKPAGASATNEQIKQASQADLSILALGDCGSCTTWLILDAIKLEKQGIPTLSICSHIFAPFARELAESYGASDLRIIEVEHPLAGQSRDAIEIKIQKLRDEIRTSLSKREELWLKKKTRLEKNTVKKER